MLKESFRTLLAPRMTRLLGCVRSTGLASNVRMTHNGCEMWKIQYVFSWLWAIDYNTALCDCVAGLGVEVLHSLDQPFSSSSGSSSQSKTNFVQVLHKSKFNIVIHDRSILCTTVVVQTAEAIFSRCLLQGRQSTTQLLLVLSDGRGVFADGVMVSITLIFSPHHLSVWPVACWECCSPADWDGSVSGVCNPGRTIKGLTRTQRTHTMHTLEHCKFRAHQL